MRLLDEIMLFLYYARQAVRKHDRLKYLLCRIIQQMGVVMPTMNKETEQNKAEVEKLVSGGRISKAADLIEKTGIRPEAVERLKLKAADHIAFGAKELYEAAGIRESRWDLEREKVAKEVKAFGIKRMDVVLALMDRDVTHTEALNIANTLKLGVPSLVNEEKKAEYLQVVSLLAEGKTLKARAEIHALGLSKQAIAVHCEAEIKKTVVALVERGGMANLEKASNIAGFFIEELPLTVADLTRGFKSKEAEDFRSKLITELGKIYKKEHGKSEEAGRNYNPEGMRVPSTSAVISLFDIPKADVAKLYKNLESSEASA